MGFKRLLFAKSLFVRLMGSFLLIIVIVSSFFVISFSLYVNNLQQQLVSNIRERFAITCNKYDYEFTKITDTLYRLYTDDYFNPVLTDRQLSYFDMFHLKNLMSRYVSQNDSINTVFMISTNSDLVVSNAGTFRKDDFFNKFYCSPSYSLDFWERERSRKFFFAVYNPGSFTDLADPNIYATQLLPIAFKQSTNSSFIMVALVDMRVITSGIDKSFLTNFMILNDNGIPIDTSSEPGEGIVALAVAGGGRSGDGYFIDRPSNLQGIVYYRFLTNLELRDTLMKTNNVLIVILVVSILLSTALAYLISRSTNNLAKKIVDIMGGAMNADRPAGAGTDLMHIRNSIQRIVAQNSQYSDDIKARDLVLEDFFYRTKIKDVHVPLNESGDRYTIKDDYILACFTLHYKEFYFEKTGVDLSMGTFRMKELLHRGIRGYFRNCITFQSENNQIVSIINANSGAPGVSAADAVAGVLDMIREEEPFVFFTAAVSAVKHDILELDSVYNGMLSLLKYRKLAEKNQILAEGSAEPQEGKFYFTLAQAEHFSEYLANGRLNECIQQVDEILDANLKNDVSNFHFLLLCTEIVNCGVKVLTNLNRDLPADMNISGVYSQLEQCWRLEQFKRVCTSFIVNVAERINTFEKSKEYIVDYIKEYVENHYSEDIYLDLFAEKLHLSKVYISLHFKSRTGINFSDWLNDFRMKKAMEMLNNTSLKVQEISRRVGCNANTFIRSFKKYSGKTPNEYRQARLLDR